MFGGFCNAISRYIMIVIGYLYASLTEGNDQERTLIVYL